MGLFDDIRVQGAAYRLTEEVFFAEALREMEAGVRRDGLWAKALSEVDCDEERAKAMYIKLRVQSLKDEVATFKAAMECEEQAQAAALNRRQANHSSKETTRARHEEAQRSAQARTAVARLKEKQRQEKLLPEVTKVLGDFGYSLEKTMFGWVVLGPNQRYKLSSLDDVEVFANATISEQRSAGLVAQKSELQGTRSALEFLNAVRVIDFHHVNVALEKHPSLIHVSNSEGSTALHLAVAEKSEAMVRLLCDSGASPDVADNHGVTPRVAARRQGLLDVLRIFA